MTILAIQKSIANDFIIVIFFILLVLLITLLKPKEYYLNQILKFKSTIQSLFKIPENRKLNRSKLKFLIPLLPMIIVGILLLIKPYYLFPTTGDLDFHLVRAREILQNPYYGLFWDYLVYYPTGRALWHPPIFHSVLAVLWYLGGIRFAHSVMCIAQILLSIGVVSWFSNKKYGPYAGFLAGIFILCSPLPDTLKVIMPATFFSIISILTLYYLPKNGKNAVILTIIGIWTHIMGSVLFLLFLVTEKGRSYLKNWKLLLPLLMSLVFWASYWTYFADKTGATNHINPAIIFFDWFNHTGFLFLLFFGIIGLYFLYHENKEDFKLFSAYIFLIIAIQLLFSDISRGLQYAAFPLAILSSLSIIRIYEYIYKENKRVIPIFLSLILICTIFASSSFFVPQIKSDANWDNLDFPFENKYYDYYDLDSYLNHDAENIDLVWADSEIADKVAWVTGKKVSNGRYGAPPDFLTKKQNLNIYLINNHFIIKNSKNATVTIITD